MNIVMTPERRAAAVERERALRASYGKIVRRASAEEREQICKGAEEHFAKKGYGDLAPTLGIEPRPGPKPMPAGRYRVIHGRICLGKRTRPDGSTYLEFAHMGDEMVLTPEDATNLMGVGVVEPIDVDAGESRVGKVWAPPKPVYDLRPGAYTVYGRQIRRNV